MHKYKVSRNQAISPSSVLITLRPEKSNNRLAFRAGQYAAVSFNLSGRPTPARCFSIVSSPDTSELQFAMRVTGDFTFTGSNLRTGDRVGVRGPYGDFTLARASSQNTIFFAGGIGVTPFISMIREATQRTIRNNITLIYSCQTQGDVPFADELMRLEEQNSNLTVIYVITRGETDRFAGRKVIRGTLTPDILDRVMRSNYGYYNYYICGPKRFMKAIERTLLSREVYSEHIFTEDFGLRSKNFPSLRNSPLGRVYAGTALSLVLGTAMVMGVDLKGTLAKAMASSPPAATVTTSSQTSTGQSSSAASTPQSDSSVNSAPTQSSGSTSTGTTTPTSQPTDTSTSTPSSASQSQTYQQPTSSVS